MKTKKVFFAVITVTLIIALIISCVELLDNQNVISNDKEEQVAPPGKTLVRLNVVNSNGRTVMPTTPGTDLGDFDYLHLTITGPSGTVTLDSPFDDDFVYITGIFSSNPIALDTGKSYTFTLIAYSDVGADLNKANDVAIALGTATETISANGGITIHLKEIMDGNGTGTLVVNPTITDSATATVTISPLTAKGSAEVVSQAVPYGPVQVNSGYYLMTLSLSLTKHESIKIVEVVYIWQGLTTTFNSSVPALRSNVHLINYDFTEDTDGGIGDGTDSEEVNHGSTLTKATTGFPGVANPTRVLAGWYDNPGLTGDPITSAIKILKPYKLYAKWGSATLDVNPAPDVQWSGPVNVDFTGSTVSVSQVGDISITITVNNASAFQAGSFQWLDEKGVPIVNNAQYSGQGTATLTITGDVTSLLTWYQPGTHIIGLRANGASAPNLPYSGYWSVQITAAP